MRFHGRVAIITGGGTGIGLATARRFAAEGASLMLVGRRPDPLEAAVAEIAGGGGAAIAVPTDVTDELQVERMVARAIERFGQVDVLVNNAGDPMQMKDLTETTLAEWNYGLAANLTSAMLCAREVLKSMIPRRSGAILNVSSQQGKSGTPGRYPYTAAKWGLIGFTQALAREAGPLGIRVNCVAPGSTLTENMERGVRQRAAFRGQTYEEALAQSAQEAALRRLTLPEETAALIAFLCSDDAKAIRGQAIALNSGRWMG
jgi:NAD(P)-dependent dehydrogenase (short-subunit alcohol dehydrogenase family)